MSDTEDPKILIVGAGPTGLTLGCELARRGVPFRLIERELRPHEQSRATDVQARTLEVLADVGVTGELVAAGVKRPGITMIAGDVEVRYTTEKADTPYPYSLGIEQNALEAILCRRLEGLGGRVERGVRLGELWQNDEAVTTCLLHADGRWAEHRFDYVVGCDGAHSMVRRMEGMSFSGSTYDEQFFLVDARVDYEFSPDEIVFFMSEHGFVMMLPLPGERYARMFGDIDLGSEPDLRDLAVCQALVDARVGKREVVLSNLGWSSTFRVHSRMVESFRSGRVFVAGDAAHIHSPQGGHGMNTGIQDAYNLGWKLALVARGEARPALLDSYDAERRPVATALLRQVDLQTRMALWRNPLGQKAMTALLGLLKRFELTYQRQVSQQMEIAVSYHDSPLSSERSTSLLDTTVAGKTPDETPALTDWRAFRAAPRPGDRAPDVHGVGTQTLFERMRGGTFDLLLFDGYDDSASGYERLAEITAEIRRRFGATITTHVVVPADRPPEALSACEVVLDPERKLHQRYGASSECLFLVRPDGYVGFRAQPAELRPLLEYCERILG